MSYDSEIAHRRFVLRRRELLLGLGVAAVPLFGPAFAQTAPQKHILRRRVEDFGARGDGVTDDAAAFRAAAATGAVCHLRRGARYALGSRVMVGSRAGFTCEDGVADVLMLTGQGRFDLATYATAFAANHVAFYALKADRPVLQGLRVAMQPNAGLRCCIPFAIRGCHEPGLAAEITGFKESFLGLAAWDSNQGGDAQLDVHDCTTNSTVLPSLQLSAMEIDNNRLGGVSSQGWRVRLRARNISLGAEAVAKYGCQTDGLTVMSDKAGGTVDYIEAERVAEPLDCWGDGVIVKSMRLKDIEHFAVKLLYGASNCRIRDVQVDGTGLAAVYVGGHSNPLRPSACSGNRIEGVVARNVGALLPRLSRLNPKTYGGAQPGFYIDGNQARWQPDHTYISGEAHGFSPQTMSYVGACSSNGAGNVFEIDGDSFGKAFFRAANGSPVERRCPKGKCAA